MALTVNRRGVLIFLVVSMICMMAADPIQTSKLSNNNDMDDNESRGNELESRKHKKYLLLLGGLKGWLVLLLIKFKIVVVSVAVAAIVIATLKFAEIFKYRAPYSSPYSIAHEPAYDYGPPDHLHDRHGNDWSSSNSYAKRIFQNTKPYKHTKYTGGRSIDQRRR